MRALAKDLDSVKHVLRLVVVGVAQVGGPLKVAIHHGQDLREGGEGFDTRIPGGLCVSRSGNLVGRDASHGLKPLIGGDYLCRIGRGSKDLRDERVWIESDGRSQLFKLLGCEALVRRLIKRRRLCGTVLVGIGALVRVILIALWFGGLLRVLLLGVGLGLVARLLGILLLAIGLGLIPRLLRIDGLLLGVVGNGLCVLAGIGTLLGPLLLSEGVDLGQREQEHGHSEGDAAPKNQVWI